VPLLRFPEQHGLSRLAVGRPVIKWEVYPSPASPVPWAPLATISVGAVVHEIVANTPFSGRQYRSRRFSERHNFVIALLDDRVHLVGPERRRGANLALICRAIVDARHVKCPAMVQSVMVGEVSDFPLHPNSSPFARAILRKMQMLMRG
jgi:hypothetical protein